MDNVSELKGKYKKIYFGLVCVEDKEICCLKKSEFDKLIENRKRSAENSVESSYAILITIKHGASFRAYVNAAGSRGRYCGEKITIPRKNFPDALFL